MWCVSFSLPWPVLWSMDSRHTGFISCGSWALEFKCRLDLSSFPRACGIFLDQRSNLCLLHWQADSLPLSHQVLDVSTQREFSDTYKVGLFTEKHTPQIDCGPSQKARTVPGYGLVSFCRGG